MLRSKRRPRRGTIVAYFLVVLSVICTGLLMTISLAAGSQSQISGMTMRRDQAFYAAEAGLQMAFWKIQQNNNWRADPSLPLTGTIGSATYSVSAVGGWNSPILIKSTGRVGTDVSSGISAVATPAVLVPAISLGNNFDNSGNVTINGDVQAKGNIATSGRFTENGSLYAGGSITTRGNVDITGSTAANTPNITTPAIDFNALVGQATQVHHVPPGLGALEVTSIDFGNGGIVYFDGPVVFKGNVNITGTGTLVVAGDVTIRAAAAFGSSSSPAQANIVTTGGVDISGYLGLVGSLYANGQISKNGGLDVTGVIVGQGDLGTSGGFTITRAQPPAFDPRSNISGSGSIKLARITGPIF